MTDVLVKKYLESHKHREGSNVTTEAESGTTTQRMARIAWSCQMLGSRTGRAFRRSVSLSTL